MSESSTPANARASSSLQANLQAVASALSSTPLDVLAAAVGKDDTVVCKIRSGESGAKVPDLVKLLHAAGLKVVPADRVCVQREKYDAMVTLVSAAMADPATARRLTWDE